MPTRDQLRELGEKCTWTWTTRNGVNGQLVTGPNGNTIFLPAAGDRGIELLYEVGSSGYYWSRTLDLDIPHFACSLGLDSDGSYSDISHVRHPGFTVRAVRVP